MKNLPACRVNRPTLITVPWHYALADLLAAEADALAEAGQPLSLRQSACRIAAEGYLGEWQRMKLLRTGW